MPRIEATFTLTSYYELEWHCALGALGTVNPPRTLRESALGMGSAQRTPIVHAHSARFVCPTGRQVMAVFNRGPPVLFRDTLSSIKK